MKTAVMHAGSPKEHDYCELAGFWVLRAQEEREKAQSDADQGRDRTARYFEEVYWPHVAKES